MKICTVAPAFERHGGVPYVARNVVAELAERGVECVVITDHESETDVKPDLDDSVEVHQLRRPDGFFPLNIVSFALRAAPVLERLNDQHEFDLVHMHGNYILLPIIADKLGKIDVPLVETAHGTYLNEIRSFRSYPSFRRKWKYCAGVYLDHLIQKYGSRYADWVHTVAQRAKPELVEMGIGDENIAVVPNGVNLSEFDTETVADDIRGQYGLEDADVAVSVGSMIPRKGVHTLVDAAEQLHRKNPDAHVVHVGGHSHGGYADYVKQRIRKLGVEDAVTLTGRVSREELLGWYDTCDVAVSAAYSEGCPINVLEAAASGCTIVSTDVGGAPDVLGEYGVYVEPGDPDSVAAGILEGFESDNGSTIRERIESEFTWTTIVDELYELLERWS